jgi:uncharacterized repeat protein (TIGR01451 family)
VALAGAALVSGGTPASAASPISVGVSASPNPVGPGQAMAFTVTVSNNGGAAASGLTLTDTPTGFTAGQLAQPAATTTTGSCTWSAPSEVCTAPSLAAGAAWTVAISGQNAAGAGTAVTDVAEVTGTVGSAFDVTANSSTPVTGVLPTGFTQTQLAHGLQNPIVLTFAPNGDIYIGEQSGIIRIFRNGSLLATPLGTLPNVFSGGECGLLGMALDPNYASNGYIYISYTPNVTNKAGVTQVFARLSRFTVVNGSLDPTTEKIYYQGNQVQNLHHPGNDLKIGPDGKLWWSVGDNVPAITNGETLTNIYGKMLRFNLDGSVPSDNPFVNVPNAVPYIYAYGIRNPFRMTFLPDGKPMVEDTGSSFWEELDTIQAGGNYGWPFVEGNCGSCGYINPAYAYGHDPVDGAVSAIAAYSGSTFPQAYDHVVFFGDYNRGDIEAVSFDPSYQTETSQSVFDSSAGTIADLVEGPDGNLYYVSIFEGTFTEISAPGPFRPTASASASVPAGPAPLTVQLSSAGSSDPYGKALSYSWNFGDGSAPSTAANPTHTYTTPGVHTATVTVSNGSQASTATTQVDVGPSPPSAAISAPTTYNAGDTVAFTGSATDPADGTLPPSAYRWTVDFYSHGVLQPSYSNEVAYPFAGPFNGVTGGTFTIPTDPSQVPGSFYRITLTVTDSQGIQTVVTHDLHPNLTSWSASTNVAGAGYLVDGAWQTGPTTVNDVVGTRHVLTGMAPAQVIGGTRYRFVGWSDGSALTDTITAGTAGASYTAQYEPVQNTVPSPWSDTDVGAPLEPGTADYGAADQTYYVDGSGADVYGANEQFHYVYQTLNGNGTIVARVRYQSDSSPWAKAGVMIAASPSSGTAFVDALVTPDVSPATPNVNGIGCDPNGCYSPLPPVQPTMGYGDRMQYSPTGSKTPATNVAGNVSPNKWIKLQRVGNSFTSWESADGVNWSLIGTTALTMPTVATIGLFVTSHNIGQYSTVAFDHVQVTTPPPPGPLPSPWVDTDVGGPSPAGAASYNGGVFTVQGSGADIWGTSDQFHYVYQPVSGNGTLVARVTSQSNTSSNAKAGIMFKQSTTAGDSYILIAAAPGGGIKVQYAFNGSVTGPTLTFPDVWMKLTRVGNVFTAYVSPDGVTWTNVFHKTITMNAQITAGLFVCSHKAGTLGTATFDNVGYTTGP